MKNLRESSLTITIIDMLARSVLFLLLLPVHVSANINGNGNVELGLSKDKNKHNFGMAADYYVGSSGSSSQTGFSSNFQIGSDEGRSLVATAAHEYQYEQSFIRTGLANELHFYHPGLIWNSQLSHSLDFKQSVDGVTEDSDTDFSNSEKTWSITTGPAFEYNRSEWLNYRTQFQASKLNVSGDESTEGNLSFGIGKSITHTSSSYLDVSKVCTKYSDNTLEVDCREEARVSIVVSGSQSTLHAEAGISQQGTTKTNIYTMRLYQPLNSYSTISLESQKSIDTISEFGQFNNSGVLNFSSAIKESDSISYIYEWGRKRFELKARQLTTTSDESVKTKDAALFYAYQLGSKLCSGCQVGMSYEYSDYGSGVKQSIRSLSLVKSHSRRISSTISFRETAISNEFNTWSINLLLSIKDLVANLRAR